MAKAKGHLVVTNDPNDDVAIRVEHVGKSFRLPHNRQNSIKGSLVNLVSRGDRTYETQEVLKDISFEIKKGEFFGIVGRNGSGKSTLLKMLAGIYTPTKGKIIVNGSLTPFIELGVGFNPELTGRENVYLNGALLGFSDREVDTMYDDIVKFAELEKFMDQRLKNYSSGMQVRLAFSIAIRARSDILVLDEVLAVGDEAFQRKCDDFFMSVKQNEARTVILVTHSMESVKKYCTNAILIDKGSIVVSGNPNDVANQYTAENIPESAEATADSTDASVRIIAKGKTVLKSTDSFTFQIETDYDNNQLYVAYSLLDIRRGGITFDSGIRKLIRGKVFEIPLSLFNSGDFRIVATLRVKDSSTEGSKVVAFTTENTSCIFSVRNDDSESSYALLRRLE